MAILIMVDVHSNCSSSEGCESDISAPTPEYCSSTH